MTALLTRRHVLGATAATAAIAATGGGIAYANEAAAKTTPAAKLPLIGPVSGDKIHVMTYNIRLIGDNDPEPKAWASAGDRYRRFQLWLRLRPIPHHDKRGPA